MKKLLGLLGLLVFIFFVAGCGVKKTEKDDQGTKFSELEKSFINAGEIFYSTYMKEIPEQNINVVSIQMMKDFNDFEDAPVKIDVKDIAHCGDESFIKIITNDAKEIINYEFHFVNCE